MSKKQESVPEQVERIVNEYAPVLGLSDWRITVHDLGDTPYDALMSTVWHVPSQTGNLYIWRAMKGTEFSLAEVVLHELAHGMIADAGIKFEKDEDEEKTCDRIAAMLVRLA